MFYVLLVWVSSSILAYSFWRSSFVGSCCCRYFSRSEKQAWKTKKSKWLIWVAYAGLVIAGYICSFWIWVLYYIFWYKREQDIKSSVSSGVLDEGWNFDHEDGRIIVQSDPDGISTCHVYNSRCPCGAQLGEFDENSSFAKLLSEMLYYLYHQQVVECQPSGKMLQSFHR